MVHTVYLIYIYIYIRHTPCSVTHNCIIIIAYTLEPGINNS